MTRKFTILIGLFALLFTAAPVLAGGWVVITLDSLPEGIQAGRPVEISFMVRQHGKDPTHDVSPILTATNNATGEEIRIAAEKALETGRFVVTANFPNTGTWEWSISAEPFEQRATLAPLTILGPEQAAASEKVVGPEQVLSPNTIVPSDDFSWQIFLRWGGLLLLATGLALIIIAQRRRPSIPSPVSGD